MTITSGEVGKVEYSVRCVHRYIVTRYTVDEQGRPMGSEPKGEYDNPTLAYDIGYALAKNEAALRGWGPGDERMVYPTPVEKPSFCISSDPIRLVIKPVNFRATSPLGVYDERGVLLPQQAAVRVESTPLEPVKAHVTFVVDGKAVKIAAMDEVTA